MTNPWQEYKKRLGDSRPWDLLKDDERIDDESQQRRYDICKSCDQFIQRTAQCKQCGCFMRLKTKLIDAACPLGKW